MFSVVASLSLAVANTRSYPHGYLPSNRDRSYMTTMNITEETLSDAPDKVDWHAKGALTPIKDQGECAACWSFSAIETVESAVFMKTGKTPPLLSEQQLVGCDNYNGTPRGHDQGCLGGEPIDALDWLQKVGGADLEEDYPYCGACGDIFNDNCTWSGKKAVKVTSYKYAIPPCGNYHSDCSKQDENALAAALARYGPLSIAVNADKSWISYKGGVLGPKLSCASGTDKQNHAVQLVGYDKSASPPYWIVRNSYGTSFGENGFIRLPMGVNACGLANTVVAVTAEPIDSSTVVV